LMDLLGPEADVGLAGVLLGDVVLVEGWSTAWQLVRHHPELRAVTPEGDLITAWGVRPANPDGAGAAVVEAARVAIERAETELARARSRHTTARRAFERSRERERTALEAVEALEVRIAGSTEALRLVERSKGEGEAEAARLEARRRSLAEAAVARDEAVGELRRRLEVLDRGVGVDQSSRQAQARRREEVTRRRREARQAWEESSAALAALIERRRLLQGRLDEVSRRLAGLGDDPADPGHLDHLTAVEAKARAGLAKVREYLESLRERQEGFRRESGETGARLEEENQRRSDLERRSSDVRQRLSELAVESAELRVRDETAAERLRRDLDASEEEALSASAPELPEGMDPGERLGWLESELRRMGPVNPLAASEYRELAERAEFLEAQLEDVEASRRELRKIISALDTEIARLFNEAFDDISGYFEENFGVLFPGGRGRLRLTDPGDPLGTGVEIRAQPAGKKISHLSLLSGGERALAALAFLFAVFRARPSPFYVLDEVEAALDAANLQRFIRLSGTLRDTSQLVIVTHQQQTVEAADILYGVTMEPG
ncbi:MAG: hypothetical protein ACE5KX_09160, partial [Acidimicrobiia bacterium]